ncbi:APC family permease [Kitasatospora sp. NPDC057940]|uniref:APC family permease n=1 Tax=Kitasatospora sp. NPDC057940 TaxID=3346285 RepID=UPI0036DB2CE2
MTDASARATSPTGPLPPQGPNTDTDTGADADADAARLAALGYASEFKRDMSLWANFSLGFTYLSPVVGVYTLFASSLATAGPPMVWSFLIAGVGQLLVALVFSEVVAQFPVAGGVYPWSRRLWGRTWGWLTGWVYLLALMSTIAAVSYGAGPYVAALLGVEPSTATTVWCALGLLLLATVINLGGTKVLSAAAVFGFAAELLGALAVGAWLLLTHRYHGLGVVFDRFGAGDGGSYTDAFLAAGLIAVFLFFGFEACGDVAEEVPNPGRQIPKSMRRTLYVGGAAAIGVSLALVMSIQDIGAVVSGDDKDPVASVLHDAFGATGARVVIGVVLISFLSCVLSLQAAASRLAYSFARDRMIVGSRLLATVSDRLRVPPYALLLAAAVPGVIIVGASALSEGALTKIISFSSIGIYLAFQMVVLAALRARLRGWRPSGDFRLGRWGLAVNIGALVYGLAAIVNICWGRTPDAAWYDDYLVLLSAVAVLAAGGLYLLLARPHLRGDAPSGDATAPAGDAR